MRKSIAMKVEIVLGLIMVISTHFVPSSAQQDLPGLCWQKIGACRRNAATPEEFDMECCPLLNNEFNNNKVCFCGPSQIVAQNPLVADGVDQLLNICKVDGTFSQVCPVPAPSPNSSPPSALAPPGSNSNPLGSPAQAPAPVPELPCWNAINGCINENIRKNRTSDPTEFMCCTLVRQITAIAKPCFCGINDVLTQKPSLTSDILQLVATCDIADSASSFQSFCADEASPAPVEDLKADGSAIPGAPKLSSGGGSGSVANLNSMGISFCVLLSSWVYLLVFNIS